MTFLAEFDSSEIEKFISFQNYDFTNDVKFQEGWRSISSKLTVENIEKDLKKAKLFYFRKNIGPIDPEKYEIWLKSSSQTQGETETEWLQSDAESIQNADKTGLANNTENRIADSDNLSFGEIVTLIQAGQTIPGVKMVDVHPTNSSPTPSNLQPRNKPWQ
ncbi:hypothetical protein SNE40_004744 [Patella caerulea]|uniref:Uncharacterized protein n=1 Tax=Patella caerulea TaxID=87958 RepID=A0AAN8K646_PATCE